MTTTQAPPGLPYVPRALHVVRTLHGQATSYCEHGTTATGTFTQPGTAATDPRIIPHGTFFVVGGHVYISRDTGSAVVGNVIDLWTSRCSDAIKWGRRNVKIHILGKAKTHAMVLKHGHTAPPPIGPVDSFALGLFLLALAIGLGCAAVKCFLI